MDLLFICRDGLENSILTNLILAIEAKGAGGEVGVLFTEDALASLTGEALDWSLFLRDQVTRVKVARGVAQMGLPTYEKPTKTLPAPDTRRMLHVAKESGVALYACPYWSQFLEKGNELPSFLTPIERPQVLKLIQETKKVIGSF